MNNDILARYKRASTLAQAIMPARVVLNEAVFSRWIENSACFWYTKETKFGKEYRLVDADAGSNLPAFNHRELADALAKATGKTVDPKNIPVEGKDATIALDPFEFCFTACGKKWKFHFDNTLVQVDDKKLSSTEKKTLPSKILIGLNYETEEALCSPDGRQEVFTRDHNVWIKDNITGEESALTKDGTDNYRYACDLLDSGGAMQAIWSSDSRYIFTVCLDSRGVKSPHFPIYVPEGDDVSVQTSPLNMAFTGDEHIECYHLFIIDMDNREVKKIDYPTLPLAVYGDPPAGFFRMDLGWWSPDNRRAFFVDITRGSQTVRVVELDAHTGSTRTLIEESSDTFVKLRHSPFEKPLFLPLPDTNELIWFSEQTDWGHLYLYDLDTGKLKQPITEGEWLVRNILHYDADRRELLLQTAARDANINPYYRDICKVNIDTGELTTLASGCFDHCVYNPSVFNLAEFDLFHGVDRHTVDGVSPCGNYIVTTRSRVDTVPVSVLVDKTGREILDIEIADISGLPSYWQWPEPVKLKAADDKTDIYGVVYRPPEFSADKKYPVLEYSSAGRGFATLPQGSFFNTPQTGIDYLNMAALAALGFIVIQIDGRGLPLRNKAFQDHHYGDQSFSSDYNDRMAGIRQLAQRYPYIDLDRVGITGIEGTPNTVYASLKHSDFYKVSVVLHSYDARFSIAMLGETYDGTRDKAAVSQMRFPEDYVESFKGKLFLICGMLTATTPAGPFRLIEALQKANKSFDMLCLPNLHYTFSSYTLRREWDYLVQHLQGIEPPKDFQLRTGRDLAHEYFKSQREE